MFISVIIPVYNKDNLLNDCIKSVLMQTHKKLEVIIINDGSTDNSENIILKWKYRDNRIRYYKHENSGVAITRNKGIELATGEYLFFLDADDELPKNALSELNNNAQKNKSDIVMGNYIQKKGGIKRKRAKPSKYQFSQKDLLDSLTQIELFLTDSRLMAMVSNKLYKLEFIKKYNIKFNSNILAEDRLFNLKCYLNNPKITAIDSYTYIYNQFPESRSQRIKPTFFDESVNLLYEFNKYIKNNPLYRTKTNENLLELIIIYDVFKIINTVFEDSKYKSRETSKVINKLKQDEIILNNLNNVFKKKKYKNINNKVFNRMKLLSYLLYKLPLGILVYKYLGLIKKRLKLKHTNISMSDK